MDLCVLDLTDWLVGFSSGEQMGDEDDDYMLIWWWESDYGFKAEKQTLQRKLKACLDSEIKYSYNALYSVGRAKIQSQNVWGQILCRLKISDSVFLWDSVAPYETNIWETWNTSASWCSCEICLYYTPYFAGGRLCSQRLDCQSESLP